MRITLSDENGEVLEDLFTDSGSEEILLCDSAGDLKRYLDAMAEDLGPNPEED